MSNTLKEILKFCPYKEPEDTEFYTMLRRGLSYEVERSNRNGYTHNYKEFGVYSRELAFSNVEYMEGNGCLRFNIEKDLLDSIVNKFDQLQAQLKERDELLKEAEKVIEFYGDEDIYEYLTSKKFTMDLKERCIGDDLGKIARDYLKKRARV